jgi:dTDP-4-dehydrorhamnose reductase
LGETTWFGLARRIVELPGADLDLARPTMDRSAKLAPSPAESGLGHEHWSASGLEPMWERDVSLRTACKGPRPDGEAGA